MHGATIKMIRYCVFSYTLHEENSVISITKSKYIVIIEFKPLLFFLTKFFYPPTDAQLNCLKINFKIYIKIYIQTAPTCFGAITIIRDCITRAC
jgi:hypothetical protein